MNRVFALCVLSLLVALPSYSQEPATIRVRKASDLSKAWFDNTERRLMVIDRFGNPRDNKIISYTLYIKTRNNTDSFVGYSNQLTREMLATLNKQKNACKLFFTRIKAVDDQGRPVDLPDVIETWFPSVKQN